MSASLARSVSLPWAAVGGLPLGVAANGSHAPWLSCQNLDGSAEQRTRGSREPIEPGSYTSIRRGASGVPAAQWEACGGVVQQRHFCPRQLLMSSAVVPGRLALLDDISGLELVRRLS